MQGWIKLHRKLLNSQMYKSLNSKQRDVMINCLLLANHEGNEWEFDGQIYKCHPGQFVTSLETLRRNCGMLTKVQSVRGALLKLEKWGFLTNKSTKTGRLVTIVKWDTYQQLDVQANKEPNKEPTKSQQSSNKAPTPNKKDKNVKKESMYTDEFLTFWKHYPNKKGKTKAFEHWQRIKNKNGLLNDILKTLDWQKRTKDWLKENGQYIPMASTYIYQKRWEDELPSN